MQPQMSNSFSLNTLSSHRFFSNLFWRRRSCAWLSIFSVCVVFCQLLFCLSFFDLRHLIDPFDLRFKSTLFNIFSYFERTEKGENVKLKTDFRYAIKVTLFIFLNINMLKEFILYSKIKFVLINLEYNFICLALSLNRELGYK